MGILTDVTLFSYSGSEFPLEKTGIESGPRIETLDN